MQCLDESFAPCLKDHDLEKLERSPGTVYAVWPDFRLAYMNPAWFRFAEANGGEPAISSRWPLGAPLMPAISATLRSFYEIKLHACMSRGEPWVHAYECSSAGVYRAFRQTVYPLKEKCGLLIVNSLSVEQAQDPVERPAKAAKAGEYHGENGAISQCAHCRRVKDPSQPARWDWVPAWVERPPENVVFVLCDRCEPRFLIDLT